MQHHAGAWLSRLNRLAASAPNCPQNFAKSSIIGGRIRSRLCIRSPNLPSHAAWRFRAMPPDRRRCIASFRWIGRMLTGICRRLRSPRVRSMARELCGDA